MSLIKPITEREATLEDNSDGEIIKQNKNKLDMLNSVKFIVLLLRLISESNTCFCVLISRVGMKAAGI